MPYGSCISGRGLVMLAIGHKQSYHRYPLITAHSLAVGAGKTCNLVSISPKEIRSVFRSLRS